MLGETIQIEGVRPTPVFLSDVTCVGTERYLNECSYNIVNVTNCAVAAVSCLEVLSEKT